MKTRIKQFRQDRGMTVEQLAQIVGMSKSYVSEIENGKKQVNGRRLDEFAAAFGVTPADLIEDEGDPQDILQLIKTIRRLSPADREAVERHARSLLGLRSSE